MAYRSSTRGPSRGSYRSASSTNAAAWAFAVVALLVVVVVVVVATGGKKEIEEPPAEPPVATLAPKPAATGPVKPPPAPFPKISDALLTKARALVKTFEAPAREGNRLYDEGMKAKQAGNDAVWQSKMEEAMPYFQGIQDAWNELVGEMPPSNDYDQEQVANHHLGSEGKQVSRYLERYQAIRKTMRLNK
jgi:hypothetical protein